MADIYTGFVNRWKKMPLHIRDNLRELLSERLAGKAHIYEEELGPGYEPELDTNIYRIKPVSGRFSVCHSHKSKALHLDIQDRITTDNAINNSDESGPPRITLDESATSELSSVRSWSLTPEQGDEDGNGDENKAFSNHERDKHDGKNDKENNGIKNRSAAENSMDDNYREYGENKQGPDSSSVENHLKNTDKVSNYEAFSPMFSLNTNLYCLLSCLMK
jgi:hypothetical protein